MPLPFLQKKQTAALIVSHRKPDGSKEESSEPEGDDGMYSCMQDLCRAIKAEDYEAAAEAFRSACDIRDSQPHEEGEHTNETPQE